MQNDFEKQVQQKMGELNLVPSEPVWTNIEKEIRKKDKRRFFIWLPLILLLAGGGLYWNYSIKKPVHSASEQQQISKFNLPSNHITSTLKEDKAVINKEKKEANSSVPFHINPDKTNVHEDAFKNEHPSHNNLLVRNKSRLVNKASIVYTPVNDIDPYKISSSQLESNIRDRFVIDHLLNEPQFNLIFEASEHKIVNTTEKRIVQTQKRKWVIGLEASIGFTNQTAGQESGNKSYVASSPGTYPSSNPMIQSPYTQSLSYSLGVTMSRKLSKSIEFQTGLLYQYLSFNVMVGQHVKQDTVFNSFSLDQYYRNSSFSGTQPATQSNYKNQLHLISLPVVLGYQPFRKAPVTISGGVILQQLIYSNMLIYDGNSGNYYNSNKSLSKFIISSTAGINYSFPFLKHRFSIGPYLNYGLINTIKERPGYLYNVNIRASVDLKKLGSKQRF